MADSSNPVLREKTFRMVRDDVSSGTMTMSGAINKSGILLLILIVSSAFAWSQENPFLAMAGGILGFIAAIVLSFKPAMSPWLAPTYAALEGLVVGTISALAEIRFPGLPGNAVAMTFATLGLMLFCYRTGLLRATPMFRRVVIFSTLAIMVTYLVDMVLSMFGIPMTMLHDSSPLSIGISVVITGVAAFNLILDFDLFERNAARSPKYMEWYCGFSLIVTLVWLYLEMIRLLSKLNKR